jgi:cysteine desulfurase
MTFGAAAAALHGDDQGLLHEEARRSRAQIAALSTRATSVEDVDIVGPQSEDERLPHLVCLGVHGVEAEPVLIGLDRSGVAVHSGSACSSESIEPSPVLDAMGIDANHSLRISVGWSTVDDDIEAFGRAFADVVAALRALRN